MNRLPSPGSGEIPVQNVVGALLSHVAQWSCSHKWVRARWQDGSYGLRCQNCMKRYPRTWDQIIGQQPQVLADSGSPDRPWIPVLVKSSH